MIVKHKRNLRRTIKRIAIAMTVMLVLFIGGGVAYVYMTGKHPSESANATVPEYKEVDPAPKPVKPAANAPVGASVNGLTTPVKPGENASLTVLTTPTAKCTIALSYNKVPSTDSGLTPKTADDYGNVTWTWTVKPDAPLGKTGLAKVTCAYNGRTGVVQADQVVAK